MKKFIISIILFLMLFTPTVGVNAFDGIEVLSIPKREYEEIENAAINESDSFANIVIFIKFADETSYTAPYDYDYYEDLFSSTTSPSLKSYYLEVSYNQLTIDSYIVNDGTTMIYYQDINDRSYYEEYDASTNPDGYDGSESNTQADREHALLKRAIDYVEDNDLISDSIDLDVNEDGDIDSITFMVSGEDDGWNTLLWPHKWNLSSFYNYPDGTYNYNAPMINGLYAYTYTFELLGNSTSYNLKVDVGVLAHETFHLISAPDLYHYYRYFNIEPVGDWGLMDGTTAIPSHMLGYMKEQYGKWMNSVDEITESGTYTLAPLADSADNLYRIDLGYSNEFIYIEYRFQEGMYEQYLPSSGLLAYRVDFDYFDDGNVQGYYNNSGIPRDELFIFRPGIDINTLPFIFPENDVEGKDEDGDIDNAAISNNNTYSEMGNDTDIAMFYSDGTLIDIKIYNVVEQDGIITFDIYLPPRIELISEIEIPEGTELYLYDGAGFEYRLNITNIPSNALVYYTLDGTTPNDGSTLYDGGIITFNASSNVVKAAVYIDGVLTSNLIKEYNFVMDIESNHNPYGDDQDITWYLDLADDFSTFELNFFSNSFLEDNYDYLYIIDTTKTIEYTGDELSNLDVSYDEDIIIQFVSDQNEDGFYGFYVEIDLLIDVQLNILGERIITLEVYDEYTELGAELTGDNAFQYTLEIIGTVDSNVLGEYVITYNVLDNNMQVIKTGNRTITVVDTTAPEIVLNGEQIIDVPIFGEYIDEGVVYADNFDTVLAYEYENNVDTDIIGTYRVKYTVTDLSGNVTIVIRTINIVDTTPPTATLLPGIDTIYVGEEHILESIKCLDNYYHAFTIVVNGTVDTSVAGIYVIEYIATEGGGNSVMIYRIVNVVERVVREEVEFVIGKSVNTIKLGEAFVPASCSLGGEFADYAYTCQVNTSKVLNDIPGTYRILYYVEIDDVIYSKISYVFVYNPDDTLVWYYDKSREGYL